MKLRLSGKDILLLTLALALGGQGTARAIISLTQTHIKRRYRDIYRKTFNEETFRSVLSRLKQQGLIKHEGHGKWHITEQGKKATTTLSRYLGYEQWKRKRAPGRIIIIFDIPEIQRKKRDYLRIELLSLDFSPLQKSVWIGGGPLPDAFLKYLRDMGLLSYVHIFSIQKFGTISDNSLF
jgi:phenylacetic acid degradation operon negative regulatory protein